MYEIEESEDFKKEREKHNVQLRRRNREEIFQKRRNVDRRTRRQQVQDMSEEQVESIKEQKTMIIDESRREILTQYYIFHTILRLINAKYSIKMLDELCTNLHSDDITLKHRGVIGIRKILAVSNEPPIAAITSRQLLPTIISFIQQKTYPQLQLEATWILTNIASGTSEQCLEIIKLGALELFTSQLKQNRKGIIDQAIWAIGNIAGDNTQFRNRIISLGCVQALVKVVESSKDKSIIKQGTWALSNLLRGAPLPNYEDIKSAVPVLCKSILSEVLDNETLSDAMWAISYMSETHKSRIQRVVETGVLPHIVKACRSDLLIVVIPAMRIIGNVSAGNEAQTEELLKAGALELLTDLIYHKKKNIRRETCWILSNIAAGTKSQVSQILSHEQLIKRACNLFNVDENNVRREICYMFSNMCHLGQTKKVSELIFSNNILQIFASLIMQDEDLKTLEGALDSLYGLLSLGDGLKRKTNDYNSVLVYFQHIPGFMDKLQSLQYHPSDSVYRKIIRILVKYFKLEDAQNMVD